MPGEIDCVRRGLEGIPDEGVIDLVRRHAGGLDCGDTRENPEIGRREALEASPESAKGRTLSRKDDDVFGLPLCSHLVLANGVLLESNYG